MTAAISKTFKMPINLQKLLAELAISPKPLTCMLSLGERACVVNGESKLLLDTTGSVVGIQHA